MSINNNYMGPWTTTKQQPTYINFIVQMTNFYIRNGRWVYGTYGQQLQLINTYIVQTINFYIGQWGPWPHRTTGK